MATLMIAVCQTKKCFKKGTRLEEGEVIAGNGVEEDVYYCPDCMRVYTPDDFVDWEED